MARVLGRRAVYKVLVGTPEGKKLLGRHKNGWKNNTELKGDVDLIYLAQDRDKRRYRYEDCKRWFCIAELPGSSCHLA